MFRPTPRKTPAPSAPPRRAFTLVELLAVIAIVGVLAAILIPTVGSMRESARQSQCTSNLRQLGSSFPLYAADNGGLYPAPRMLSKNELPASSGITYPPSWINPSQDNWQAEISRYVLRDGLLGDIKKVGADANIAHCPSFDQLFASVKQLSSSNYKTAGYGMNMNLNVGGININTTKDPVVTDKSQVIRRFRAAALNYPASTVLVADSSDYHIGVDKNGWIPVSDTDPASPNGKPDGYSSGAPYRHKKSANYLFADGHVASLASADAITALLFKP